ncbi:heavy metal sensor signal transduction histidine kinase [Paraburkholderia megapolitana]|uniref:Sensor protein n=2 Tax=Paraburkholderia megapolitana TaxID=420953 RepID=A0A1I3DME0_9BURK|nr:heavy metal sensor histidine kinase [Paraburkholderia megapolitana]SFH87866.1 heavy metal sensor signal transduction histidine kinase [Paraburkholderia megapolitana]
MMNLSISRRLSIMFAMVSLLVFTLVGVGLFVVMERQLSGDVRATLDARAEIARSVIARVSTPEKWHFVTEHLSDLSPAGRPLFFIQSSDPRFRFGTPFTAEKQLSTDGRYRVIRVAGLNADMVTTEFTVPAAGVRPAVDVVVAGDCTASERTLHHLAVTLAALIALACATVLLLSSVVTRFGLRPLARLSDEAGQVSAGNRGQRLRTDELPGELHDLATSFNGALERLDGAYGRLESFNADVAHELRTPVSILIGQTEVALTRDRSIGQLQQTLQSNLEELERLRVIVNDMLFLSRRDRGERAINLTDVWMADEITRMLDFMDIAFDEAQLRVELSGNARASVDPSLVGRALTNLLTNAIQHSQPGGTVSVSAQQRGELVFVAVSNVGTPIAPELRMNIFERFYRLDESRSNSGENHGLGLAIVKAVAEMHGGSVFVSCEDGVNTFGFSVAAASAHNAPDERPVSDARRPLRVPEAALLFPASRRRNRA